MCQLYSEYGILETHLHKNVLFQNLTTPSVLSLPQSFVNGFGVCIFPLYFFHTFFILCSPLDFSHIFYFILTNCFFLLQNFTVHFRALLAASFQTTGFIGSLCIFDPDGNHFTTPKLKKNPPCRLSILCFSTCLTVNMPRSSKLFLMTSRAESCH